MEAQTSKHTKNALFSHDCRLSAGTRQIDCTTNESHVVRTVAHRINSPRLGWAEQSVVMETEAQTSKRKKELVIFALP